MIPVGVLGTWLFSAVVTSRIQLWERLLDLDFLNFLWCATGIHILIPAATDVSMRFTVGCWVVLGTEVSRLGSNTARGITCHVSHGDAVVVDWSHWRTLFDYILSIHRLLLRNLDLAHVYQERQSGFILSIDAHIEQGNDLVSISRYTLVEHLVTVLALCLEPLQDLIGNNLLAFDKRIGEVVEASLWNRLLKSEPIYFEEPECHVSLSILDSQGQAVLSILVFIQRVTAVLTHEELYDLGVTGIRRQVDRLTLASRRLDSRFHSLFFDQVADKW